MLTTLIIIGAIGGLLYYFAKDKSKDKESVGHDVAGGAFAGFIGFVWVLFQIIIPIMALAWLCS